MIADLLPAPVRLRSAAPPASPPPPPASPPKPVEQMTAPELTAYRSALLAEADQLAAVKPAERTADQTARFGTVVTECERVSGLIDEATTQERLVALRSRQAQPTRPAPGPHLSHNGHRANTPGEDGEAEAFALWMRSFTDHADTSPDAAYRSAQYGYPVRSGSVKVTGGRFNTLNVRKRAMSRIGVGTGKELVPASTMADRITDYLSFFSPIVGIVDSEVTPDGNDRDYPIVDDTALISSRISASGGTEVNPTVPDRDMATAMKRIKAFDYTSGYHKMTRQVVQDSPAGIMERVARAIANSDARAMEKALCVGDGIDEAQGLVTAATAYAAPVDDLDYALLEGMYFSVPEAYRPGVVWLMAPKARTRAVQVLKETTGKSLFGKTVADGIEVQTLFERPVYVSEFMPTWAANAAPVVLFHPAFYLLRPVAGRQVDMLDQKFHPLLALASMMRFGGAWLGPASACKKLVLDAAPVAVP
jgi:HK97 family phage major capsid protein